MTSGPFQPVPTGPIDEADLLALVEGQALAGDRAARVREALANDPALAELVTLLRADRDAVASLPTVAAPHDLLDRVEAQLEREALVGLARTEAAAFDDQLPVSAVVPQRRRWVSARVGGVLAAAAAVALIAGGVLMMVPGKRARPLPSGNGLADAGAGDERGGPSVAGAGVGVRHGDETTTPGAVPAPGPVEVAAAKPETALVGPVLPDDAFVARAAGPTIEELLAAAVEGRLVLRLRTDERTARARLDDVNATARTVRVSLLAADASAGVGRALAAAYSRPAPVSVRPPAGPEQPGVASGTGEAPADRGGPLVQPAVLPRDAGPPEPEPVVSAQAFVATIPAAAESLEALRRAMGTLRAEWRIMPEPVRIDAPSDPASILWWTAPAAEWGPRLAIPVVVQTN